MGAFIDMTGRVCGRLTVIGPYERRGNRTYWKCRCSCPEQTEKYIFVSSLTRESTQSCGCIHREVLLKRNTKHGKAYTNSYFIWQAMKDRCLNSLNKHFNNYGGRGICIDPSWLDFNAFYKDMGDKPSGKSLGRIDNNGPYSKKNCRWETDIQQANNRRTTRYFTHNGETKPLREWAEELGLNPGTVTSRRLRGRAISQVLEPFTPGMNTRKDATLVEFGGTVRPLSEVALQLGLSRKLLQSRYCKGWRGEQLFSPLMRRGGHNNLKYKKKQEKKEGG